MAEGVGYMQVVKSANCEVAVSLDVSTLQTLS